MLMAYDGAYLGRLDYESDAESIFNPTGKYGNTVSVTSIWCDYCRYGDDYSPTSAFSSLSSYPPVLYDGTAEIGYVTTNPTKKPSVTPQQLLAYAYSIGWKS